MNEPNSEKNGYSHLLIRNGFMRICAFFNIKKETGKKNVC